MATLYPSRFDPFKHKVNGTGFYSFPKNGMSNNMYDKRVIHSVISDYDNQNTTGIKYNSIQSNNITVYTFKSYLPGLNGITNQHLGLKQSKEIDTYLEWQYKGIDICLQ